MLMNDIFKLSKSNNKPLFLQSVTDGIAFMQIYFNSFEYHDFYLSCLYGMRCLLWDDLSIEESLKMFTEYSTAYIYAHSYELNKQWEVLQMEYNPIWNVEGTESETTNGKTNIKTGTESLNINTGNNDETTTNYNVPNDSAIEKETSKSNVHIDEHTDNHVTTYNTEDAIDITVTKTRGGNIGVTMTQQLINAELELREKSFYENLFQKIVFSVTY